MSDGHTSGVESESDAERGWEARSEAVRLREVIPTAAEGTLYVDLDLGTIRVESHDEPLVSIEAEASGWAQELVSFSVAASGNDVYLDGQLDEWLPGLVGGTRVRATVRVPRPFAVDAHTGGGTIRVRNVVGRVAADSTGGLLEIDGIEGSVMASTAGGAIRLRRIRGDLRAYTAGGSIGVRGVVGRTHVRTLGGPIRVSDAAGPVEAQTAAGPITVRFRGSPAGHIHTGAGPIDVKLGPGGGAELDATCIAGGVHLDRKLDFSGQRSSASIVGRVAGGGQPLVLRAGAGGIRVRADD